MGVWAMAAAALVIAAALSSPMVARETDKVTLGNGTTIEYVLVLPEGYDPARSYEALLAFPGGDQTLSRTIETVDRFWEREASKRGIIVVAPAAPSVGRPFYTGDASINLIPEFLQAIRGRYAVAAGKIHVAGHSNGGISAFRAAIRFPELFESLTVIAGVPAEWVDFDRLDRLEGIRINLFVGSTDADWRGPMMVTRDRLSELGIPAKLTIVARSGHFLEALSFEKSGPVFDSVVPKP